MAKLKLVTAAERVIARAMRARPAPPTDLDGLGEFRPAPEIIAWARETFIEAGSVLENPEHAHLQQAHLAALWTNVPNGRHMKAIAATCELGKTMAQGKWPKARAEQQLRAWFGDQPDFILTFYVDYAAECSDAAFCALVEHELKHAGQERDEFGAPKFSKTTGRPVFGICGHDVEEFVSVVRRYGAGVAAGDTAALVAAANAGPEIAAADIERACGVCLKAA